MNILLIVLFLMLTVKLTFLLNFVNKNKQLVTINGVVNSSVTNIIDKNTAN